MDRYAILCTESQTRKALTLGAPIETCGYYYKQQFGCNTISDTDLHIIPTAEQMIGWLEEQGIMFNIATNPFDEFKVIMSKAGGYDNIANIEWNESRKEATIAAIDAALEYLENIKQ